MLTQKSLRLNKFYLQFKRQVFSSKTQLSVNGAAEFFYQLQTFLSSGINIIKALHIMKTILKKPAHQQVIQSLELGLNEGLSLGAICKKHDYFDRLTQHLIAIGEETGRLNDTLKSIAMRYENKAQARKKLLSLTLYPCILLVSALSLIAFMIINIIPKFEDIFASHQATLPLLTRIVMHISHCLPSYLINAAIATLTCVLLFMYGLHAYPRFKYHCHQYLCKCPLIGTIILSRFYLQFAQVLFLTMSSGLSLVNGLLLCTDMTNNLYLRQQIVYIIAQVREGQLLSKGLMQSTVFSPLVLNMIEMGEQSGQFEHVFAKISEFYACQLQHFISRSAAILEPLIIILLGVLIGGIVIALYLPIFQLGTIF